MYCHVDKLSYRASNTILSCTSVHSFILTITDGQRKVHLTVISKFCPSYRWCWITFRQTKQIHLVTFFHDLLTRNVCNSWFIFKRKKINKIHKIVRDFIYNTNSDQILSDFRSSNVKVCQLRSQVQSYDSKSNELFTNLHCTSIVDVSVALPHSLLASHRYSPAWLLLMLTTFSVYPL